MGAVGRQHRIRRAGGVCRFRTSVGLAEAAFDRARRDVESVGLAFIDTVTAPEPGPFPNQETARQALRSIIRTMGRQKRYQGGWDESDSAPRSVTNLCERLAARNGVSKDEVLEWARTSLNREGLLVEPMKWVLLSVGWVFDYLWSGLGTRPGYARSANTSHLHPSAGVCANDLCTGNLIESPQAAGRKRMDYVGWLARLEPRPMAVEDSPVRPSRLRSSEGVSEPSRASSAAEGEPADPGHRRAERHHHHGGRCRHRLAPVHRHGERAPPEVQLPAASRPRRSSAGSRSRSR